jgi:hypothetical protein
MHLMILWNSVQTSKEIQKYLTIVNPNFVIFFQIGGFFLAVLNFHDPEF